MIDARGESQTQQPAQPGERMERRARWGRVLLWALIANIAFTGLVGPYLLPDALYRFLLQLLAGEYVDQAAVLAEQGWVDVSHRVLGLGLLMLGMVQFDHRLRRRYPRAHRWSGRLFLILLVVVATTALILGFVVPFSGPTESVFVVVVSALLLGFSVRAWRTAQQRQFAQHREWMLRTFGLCLFVAVQRVLFVPMIVFYDWSDQATFLLSNWMAVLVVLIAAESWINLTRPPLRALP